MRERDIEAHLVRKVKELGGEIRKVNWIGRASAPDRLVLLPERRSIWVELKAPGKVPTPQQLREHNRMRAMGELVKVIDSIEQVEELLA